MPLSPSDRALGDLLVGRRVITLPQLDEATGLAERWNVRLGDALLSRNWMDPRLYYETFAQNFDLPFVDLMRDPPDLTLLNAADADLYAGRLTMPWRRRDDRLLIATAEPGPETLAVRARTLGRRHRIRRGVEIRCRVHGADGVRRGAVAPRRIRARRPRSGNVGAHRVHRPADDRGLRAGQRRSARAWRSRRSPR